MKSLVVKRSIVVHGQKTSVSLEDMFWRALKELAAAGGTNLSELVGSIATSRAEGGNLSSAIRVHVVGHFRDRAASRAATAVTPNLVSLQEGGTPAASAAVPSR